MKDSLRRLGWFSVPFLVLVLPVVTGSAVVLDFVAYVLVYGLLAMSLNLLIGTTGLVSFGHAMFFALGAYGFAVGMGHGLSLPAAMALAIGLCVLAAFLVGIFCVRLQHTYFSFITLAFAMLLVNVIDVASGISGGDSGRTIDSAGLLLGGIDLSETLPRYWFIACAFTVSALLLLAVVNSAFGATLRMVRDNAQRASCLGVNVYLSRLMSFTVSGCFAGVSGVLATFLVSGAYPTFAAWTTSGDAIFAILLGGVHLFWGPLLGSFILRGLIDFTALTTGHTGLVLGGLLLLIVLGLRQSPMDWLAARLRTYQSRRRASLSTVAITPLEGDSGA